MYRIGAYLTREVLSDHDIFYYSAKVVTMSMLRDWSDDLLKTLDNRRNATAAYIIYDVSATKASLTFLMLTERDMLNPGITRVGKLRLEHFLKENRDFHIYFAVIVSESASGKIAQMYNNSDTLPQVTGKIFFSAAVAIEWMKKFTSSSAISTRRIRHIPQQDAYPVIEEPRQSWYGERDHITLLIGNETMMHVPLPPSQSITIGRLVPHKRYRLHVNLGAFEHGITVSKQHAQIALWGGRLYIADLNSTNGTLINGNHIASRQPYLLHRFDSIRVGRISISILY